MTKVGALVVYAAAVFVVPALVSKFKIGGDWRQIAISYALWFGFLSVILLMPGAGVWKDRVEWTMIFAVLLSCGVVPVLTLIQRVIG